jgi:CHAT domain-containing protein
MYEDPAHIFYCDLPLGWFAEAESTAFRLVFRNWQWPRDRIVLSLASAAASATADEDDWTSAARQRYGLPEEHAAVQLGGASVLLGSWREPELDVTRVVRRAARLDLVVDRFGERTDEVVRRDVLRMAMSVRLPTASTDVPTRADLEGALAEVDRAAQAGGEDFERALASASAMAAHRWTASVAQLPGAVDLDALAALVMVELRGANASSDALRLLRVHGLLLRVVPGAPRRLPAAVTLHEAIEEQVTQRIGAALPAIRTILTRIGRPTDSAPELDLQDWTEPAIHYLIAEGALRELRSALQDGGPELDHNKTLGFAREIVEASLVSSLGVPDNEDAPVALLLATQESLVTYIDEALTADRIQEAADAASLLCHQARLTLRRVAPEDEAARRAAYRWLTIGLITRANTLVRSADETSLHEALDLLEQARTSLTSASGPTEVDLLNLLHHEALACLQLADVERAQRAIATGIEHAQASGEQYQLGFFRWAAQVAAAFARQEPRVRSMPELQASVLSGGPSDLDAVCGGLEEAIAENPLSIQTLEVLALAGMLVPPARAELQAAALAVLDLRRLLVDRQPDLRIGADDSLLARQLSASAVEDAATRRDARATVAAADHARSRSLVLDLMPPPERLAALRDEVRRSYGDAAYVQIERFSRQRQNQALRPLLPPPWLFPRAPGWLRQRATHLRDWCASLTGVVGAAPLTEDELLQTVAAHGEPVLLLHPLHEAVGLFLIRPDGTVLAERSAGPTEAVLSAVQELRSSLHVWQSSRDMGDEYRPPPEDTLEAHRTSSRAVYQQLVGPIADGLENDSRLTIVPYRELLSIPYALLADAGDHPLAERFGLSVAPSISTLRALQRRAEATSSADAFVLGDPETAAAHKVGRLHDAAAEAAWLAAEVGVEARLGKDASPTAYRNGAAGVGLVHLACHGGVGDVARESCLVLAPDQSESDLLTAAEIERVPLGSALAFLAACRSGTGRATADGTIGLSRAFLKAGANAVIAALWNVPDTATRHLVQHFYGRFLHGLDAATSLQQAMDDTRVDLARRYGLASPDDVHPAGWGAFILLGLGGLRRSGTQRHAPTWTNGAQK